MLIIEMAKIEINRWPYGIDCIDTVINTRINGATKERPFVSNIGTPQGDSLSPVLFSVYLENALKEVKTILPRPTNELEKTLPTEIAYADDEILLV